MWAAIASFHLIFAALLPVRSASKAAMGLVFALKLGAVFEWLFRVGFRSGSHSNCWPTREHMFRTRAPAPTRLHAHTHARTHARARTHAHVLTHESRITHTCLLAARACVRACIYDCVHACETQVISLLLGKPDELAFRTPLFHAAAGALVTMFNSLRGGAPEAAGAAPRKKNGGDHDSDDDETSKEDAATAAAAAAAAKTRKAQ
jgi:hypothetical protein